MSNEKNNSIEKETVLKGLECCVNNNCTYDCPYFDVDFCSSILKKDFLALISNINCQKESLQKEKEQLLKRISDQKHALYESQAYIAELQAELKRLTEKPKEQSKKSQYLIASDNIESSVIISAENIKDCAIRFAEYMGDKSPLLIKALVGCDTVKDVVEMYNHFAHSKIKAIYKTAAFSIEKTLYRKEE